MQQLGNEGQSETLSSVALPPPGLDKCGGLDVWVRGRTNYSQTLQKNFTPIDGSVKKKLDDPVDSGAVCKCPSPLLWWRRQFAISRTGGRLVTVHRSAAAAATVYCFLPQALSCNVNCNAQRQPRPVWHVIRCRAQVHASRWGVPVLPRCAQHLHLLQR